MRRFRSLLKIFAAASAVGLLFALAASYIHFQLEQSGGTYTSFCNVNAQVNCDTVLASRFAKMFGIPLAWLAALAHAALGGVALAMLSARDETNTRLLGRILVIGGIGSAVFSAYMAFLSFTVLETACLMCLGLYAAAATQLAAGLMLPRAFSSLHAGGTRLFPRNALLAVAAAVFLATAALGRFVWSGGTAAPAAAEGRSLAQLRELDPEFYDWYVDQPVSSSAAARGKPALVSAAVVIVEFSDFECAHCRRNRQLIRDLEARHPDIVRVVHRHFPLDPACNEAVDQSIHPHACRAAEAAECAELQHHYAEMADVLFANQQRLFDSNLERLAAQAGLDLEAFRACMASRETVPKILADTRAGRELDITSTPTLFFNGRRVKGTLADAAKYDLAVMIEARIAAGDQLTDTPEISGASK
jgi:protein-disulfide isomerase/uncharacterized membrane protein